MTDIQWLTPPSYDDILSAADGCAIAVKGGKAGVVNDQNETVVPFAYDPAEYKYVQASATLGGVAILQKAPGVLCAFQIKTGQPLIEGEFEALKFWDSENYPNSCRDTILAKREGKFGLLNFSGDWVMSLQFDQIWPADGAKIGEYASPMRGNPLYYTGLLDGKAGLFDSAGRTILPLEYIHIALAFTDGMELILAKKQVSEAPMDIITEEYNRQTGRMDVQKKQIPTEKWGILNLQGEPVLPFAYDEIYYAGLQRFLILDHALQYVWYGSKRHETFVRDEPYRSAIRMGIVRSDGTVVAPPRYQLVGYQFSSDGTLPIKTEDDLWGAVDLDGREILPLSSRQHRVQFQDGLSIAVFISGTGNKIQFHYGFMDRSGELVIPARYERVVSEFRDGRAIVQQKNVHFVIDTQGRELWAFEDVKLEPTEHPHYARIARYYKENKRFQTGLLNLQTGNLPITDTCKSINTEQLVALGVVLVNDASDLKGYVRADGTFLTPIVYQKVEPFSEGLALVKRAGKYGFINLLGAEVIPPVLGAAGAFRNGCAIASLNRKKGVLKNPCLSD